jgi:hypothetical protein
MGTKMPANLRNFFNHFREHGDVATVAHWKFDQYETKFGDRREISLFSSAMIIETPLPTSGPEFSMLVIDTQEQRLYKHMAYLLHYFASYMLEEQEVVDVRMFGNSYQAVLCLERPQPFEIDAVYATGTLERVDRHGNFREVEKSRINKVRFSRIKEVQQ